jgi:hypothetical protein
MLDTGPRGAGLETTLSAAVSGKDAGKGRRSFYDASGRRRIGQVVCQNNARTELQCCR